MEPGYLARGGELLSRWAERQYRSSNTAVVIARGSNRLRTSWQASRLGRWLTADRVPASRSYQLLQNGAEALTGWLRPLPAAEIPAGAAAAAMPIVGTAAAGSWSRWGLLLTVGLLPFVAFKYLLLLSLLCLGLLLVDLRQGRIARLWISPTWIPLGGLLLVMLYATATSIAYWLSLSEFLIPVTGLLLVLVMSSCLDRPARLEEFLLAPALAGLITALYAIYFFYYGPTINTLGREWIDLTQNPDITNRAYAVFENPNSLAQYLVLLTCLCLGGLTGSRRTGRQLFFGLTAIAAVAALFLTYSRGGLLALAAALLVFVLVRSPLLLLAGSLPAALAAWFLLPASVLKRLATSASFKDSSNAYRLDTWHSAWNLVQHYWLTGVGLGRRAFSRVYATEMINANYVPHAHNLVLQLLSELGAAGLLLWLWVLGRLLRTGLRLRGSASPLLRSVNAAALAALTGFLVHSSIDYFLWYYKLAIMFWLIIGIFLVLERQNQQLA